MTKIIDLSKPVKTYPDDPFFMKVKISHTHHKSGRFEVRFLGLPFRLFPKGFRGWANDTIKKMGVHSATHVDAPWHYGEECEGRKARTVDELPLEWFYGDGVVIDMTHKKDMEPILVSDLEEAVEKTKIEIKEGTIVLIRTGRDRFVGKKEYPSRGTGMSAEATEWLIDRGVKVMGIDAWGWDRPLQKTASMIKKGKLEKEAFWEGHRVGCRREYCHIEQVVGLDQLPPDGFKVVAMPLKLVGCSGAPVRLAAIFEDDE